MPTPIAHSIVSLTLSDATKRDEGGMLKEAVFWILLGNAADFDFIPGILLGFPSRFHHGSTHSILFAIVLAVMAYIFYPRLFKGSKAPFWIFLCVTGSHPFLDCLTYDTVAPFGLPLLWPFSHATYRFPFSLFLNVNRGMSLGILLSWHNLLALCLEVGVTLPFLLWVRTVRFRRGTHISRNRGIIGGKKRKVLSN